MRSISDRLELLSVAVSVLEPERISSHAQIKLK